MTTHTYPVVVPYRLSDSDGAVRTVQVNCVAQDARQAGRDGRLIAEHWLRIRGLPGDAILAERVSVGSASPEPGGPYLLILSDTDIVQTICFPPRIDSAPGERLGQILDGLDQTNLDAVIMVCSELTYINTVGLTSIAAHVKRRRIILAQVPETVFKVFEIVGLTRYVSILAGLEEALVAVPART